MCEPILAVGPFFDDRSLRAVLARRRVIGFFPESDEEWRKQLVSNRRLILRTFSKFIARKTWLASDCFSGAVSEEPMKLKTFGFDKDSRCHPKKCCLLLVCVPGSESTTASVDRFRH